MSWLTFSTWWQTDITSRDWRHSLKYFICWFTYLHRIWYVFLLWRLKITFRKIKAHPTRSTCITSWLKSCRWLSRIPANTRLLKRSTTGSRNLMRRNSRKRLKTFWSWSTGTPHKKLTRTKPNQPNNKIHELLNASFYKLFYSCVFYINKYVIIDFYLFTFIRNV